MLNYYKTVDGVITQIDAPEKNAWISLIAPTDDEIDAVMAFTGVDEDFLRAALDEEETSRVELDDETGHAFITVDVPIEADHGENNSELLLYSTLPVGIIETQDYLITVCLQNNTILDDFAAGRVKHVVTNLKSRFIFQFLYVVAVRFLIYLRRINRMSNRVEQLLYRSMKNQELIQMLDLEKSLVYFSTSLKSNQLVIEKLQRGRIIEIFEEDQELIDDVMIEMDQAIEMSNIYSNILSGTMDAFASLISNNLNIVMKVLTAITILMAIPTMISSFYGMNVTGLPFSDFLSVIIIIVVLTIVTAVILYKNNMFH